MRTPTGRAERDNRRNRGKARREDEASRGDSAEAGRELPLYCDYMCPKAEFPSVDAVGACRTEQAVWCSAVKRFNKKNGKCLVREK